MFQRTVASIFLFTLLFAQAAQGLCQLRCDNMPSVENSVCHSMGIAAEHPSAQAKVPCSKQSCPADHTLPIITQAFQPDLAIHITLQSLAIAATPFGIQSASPINSPPRPKLLAQSSSPTLPRLTSLRL